MKKGRLFLAGALAVACSATFAFAACGDGDRDKTTPTAVITVSVDDTEITAGEQITLTWSATENAQVRVSYTLNGTAEDDLAIVSGEPITISEAGTYVFTFTAEGAETETVTVTVSEEAETPEEPHVHTYGAWQVTKVPTMSEEGSATRTCTAEDCDDPSTATDTLTLPALGTEGAYTTQVKTAATCEGEGTATYTYTAKNISFDVTVPALGHKYQAVTVAYNESMTQAWTAETTCENDTSHKLTLNMAAFNASEWTLDTEDGYTAPSHTADGRGNYVRTVTYFYGQFLLMKHKDLPTKFLSIQGAWLRP